MASTVASLSTPATAFAAADVDPRRKAAEGRVWFPVARRGSFAVRSSGPGTPPGISDKVSESIKKVEELSAAASHARDKLKDSSDPLENYCKENPETDECRIYDN
ncbi:hypothetical protein PVAP13_5KG216500 [Panicum virgatum]|uniref:CP12 domain-containing protein n=1 Tax=Panicum virgatum TaxID=38727 RepID=A0A8T0SL60_PANVG|nr:hypothetical protein PVAP13_5KG216500 [Panicum virgatum]